ncbi:MAG: family 20 glycosylhydrolase [Novosphingobium sp.]|nr:family 20 glycosylhydrolase [Novosphingobium sp.]
MGGYTGSFGFGRARVSPIRLLLAALLGGLAVPAAAQELPRLLPEPASIEAGQGSLAIGPETRIVVAADDSGARNAAERFAELVKRNRGLVLPIVTQPAPGAIRFRRGGVGGEESYRLDVSSDGATITSPGDSGLLYGGVTLWQAMTQDAGKGAVTVTGFTVADAPRFRWRGLMLDSARHFKSLAYVHSLIDWMAANKLNTLHWHLVDDQGWRIEIRKYPKLTQVSGWRHPATAPGAPQLPLTGGFYTQDQLRETVAYAAKRGITIVPEIEMPGHALAAIRAYPWLGTGTPIPPGTESDWGVFPWLYNVDDRTFDFLKDVLSEVMAVFPSKYIHVGGDEAVKDQWKASPAVQARMKALGITDEDAMQGWFIGRIDAFLTEHGRQSIGWDEILDGGRVSPNATITSWRGIEGAVKAARSGHDAVLSPAPILYFDNRQGFGPLEPPGRGHLVDLKSVYAFDPAPDAIPLEQQKHILGLQANLWTEHVRTDDRAAWQTFPRASAVAEIGWTPERERSFAGFIDRLVPQMARMKVLGLKPAASAFTVTPTIDYPAGSDHATVALANQSGLEIRYTTDGSVVTGNSPVYDKPLALALPTRLRAASFHRGAAVDGAIDVPLTAASVRRRTDEQLKSCKNRVLLAVEDDWPADGARRAHFLFDIFDPCWLFENAPLGGAKTIALEVGQTPFNWQIGKDIETIHFAKPTTPAGEFEVRAGGCEGERIAVLPLAPAVRNPGITRLTAAIEPRAGNETLCISYTARGVSPQWAVKSVELQP